MSNEITRPGINVVVSQKQADFLNAHHQKEGCVCGGRGMGKTTLLAFRERTLFNFLPKAKFLLAGNTFNQLYNIVLPTYRNGLEKMGLTEYSKENPGGQYVVGRKPPSHFLKAYKPPEKHEAVISFINGYTRQLLSFDRADMNRGGNYDGGDIDEVALFSEEDYDYILRPMVRGNKGLFHHPLHKTIRCYTSIPREVKGNWIFRFEEKMEENPKEFLWLEGTAADNPDLGMEYILEQKKSLPKHIFDLEIMNKRVRKLPNCFYSAFNEKKHTRTHTYSYDWDEETGKTYTTLTDWDKNRRLKTTWDFNAHFTSLIVSQKFGRERRVFDEMWVKEADGETLVEKLANAWCDKYESQVLKEVVVSGDPGGKKKFETRSSYQQIEDVFRKRGWEVEMIPLNAYPAHQHKHRVINAMLAENNPRLSTIAINANTCPFLIKSILNTPILGNFEKDKRSEEQAIAQEYATHLSDCFDYDLWEDAGQIYEDDDIGFGFM